MYPDAFDTAPLILDPITDFNVAKSSYRINEIRNIFFDYYQKLNELKITYDAKIDSDSILYEFLKGV
jgi:hypothetical protein